MSTYARDLKTALVEKLGIVPSVVTTTAASPTSVDMLAGDGLVNVAVHLGTVHADTVGAVTVEESDASGSGFAAVTLSDALSFTGASDNTTLRATFQRTKRYVRTPIATSGATESAALCVVIQQQAKQYPAT